jgi:hypothetical protein
MKYNKVDGKKLDFLSVVCMVSEYVNVITTISSS